MSPSKLCGSYTTATFVICGCSTESCFARSSADGSGVAMPDINPPGFSSDFSNFRLALAGIPMKIVGIGPMALYI